MLILNVAFEANSWKKKLFHCILKIVLFEWKIVPTMCSQTFTINTFPQLLNAHLELNMLNKTPDATTKLVSQYNGLVPNL